MVTNTSTDTSSVTNVAKTKIATQIANQKRREEFRKRFGYQKLLKRDNKLWRRTFHETINSTRNVVVEFKMVSDANHIPQIQTSFLCRKRRLTRQMSQIKSRILSIVHHINHSATSASSMNLAVYQFMEMVILCINSMMKSMRRPGNLYFHAIVPNSFYEKVFRQHVFKWEKNKWKHLEDDMLIEGRESLARSTHHLKYMAGKLLYIKHKK